MFLCLETSTAICSVALCDRNGIISYKESTESKSHAAYLTLFIKELLSEAGITARKLDAVAVSKGPGSYTGLRIGVSAAKGIAYGASIPLIGIETTTSMFYGITWETRLKYLADNRTLYVPVLDARRMEVYYAILDSEGKLVSDIKAEVISENSFSAIPESVRMLFFGDGSEKCQQTLRRQNTGFIEEYRLSATFMHKPVLNALENHHFEDIAYFEPYYLKDFLTSRPKKNILGR
jgi:tRNA threonylcarbamoyladenosine biosynthesis protein TsaB